MNDAQGTHVLLRLMKNGVVVMLLALFSKTVVIHEYDVEDSAQVKCLALANGVDRSESMLSHTYYLHSCPRAYDIVRENMQIIVQRDPGQAAAILRVFFHDCFVQGCDGSVLLNYTKWLSDDNGFGSTIVISEQNALPNFNSLRASAFKIIEDIKEVLEGACPFTVSCADVLALAARDAVFLVKGPWIPIMTGRKDSYTAASNETVIANLPVPTQGFSALKRIFGAKGLDAEDLIALSGAHTIGRTHCRHAVDTQLRPAASKDLSPRFAANVSRICGSGSSAAHLTLHLDGFSPDAFDNSYYRNVEERAALFHSDASLLSEQGIEGRALVRSFAARQGLFFERFAAAFIRMSSIDVLAANRGEVRRRCNAPNSSG